MPRARVYENPDGTVRVLHPAPSQYVAGETEQETLERVGADTEAKVPALAGLPSVDMDVADLPERTDRAAWRMKNGKVKG